MEKLKVQYATIDEIPEAFRPLYEERGGQFLLAQIEGLKTEADVARVQRALDSEKTAHGKIKTQWGTFFGDKKPEEVQAILDRVPELEEIAASKNINDAKLNELADARARNKIAPLERELATLKTQVTERDAKITGFETADKTRKITDLVRGEAMKVKVIDSAIDDVLMNAERVFEIDGEGNVVTKEGSGITPGLNPSVWLTEMQSKRSHWWPASKGGGAGGGQGFNGATNPWSKAAWNLTEQGKAYVADPGKAQQMALAAGSKIGATAPPVA